MKEFPPYTASSGRLRTGTLERHFLPVPFLSARARLSSLYGVSLVNQIAGINPPAKQSILNALKYEDIMSYTKLIPLIFYSVFTYN
jgi:hypothetical protein